MKLKNKIIISFLFLILLILFFNIHNVFASFIYEYNNTTYTCPDLPTVPEGYNYTVIFFRRVSSSTYRLYLLHSDKPFDYVSSYSGNNIYTLYWSYASHFNEPINFVEGHSVNSGSWETYSFTNSRNNVVQEDWLTPNNIIYANYDVYCDNTLVFHQPVPEPVVEPEPETPEEPNLLQEQETVVVIPALETAEQIPSAMGETARIVIPVGLIVLSIGLVIYIIKRVIYSM